MSTSLTTRAENLSKNLYRQYMVIQKNGYACYQHLIYKLVPNQKLIAMLLSISPLITKQPRQVMRLLKHCISFSNNGRLLSCGLDRHYLNTLCCSCHKCEMLQTGDLQYLGVCKIISQSGWAIYVTNPLCCWYERRESQDKALNKISSGRILHCNQISIHSRELRIVETWGMNHDLVSVVH